MSPTWLLWPMVIHALVTASIYFPMSRTRIRGVVDGKVKTSVYRLLRDEPEESLKFSNAIRNQNETGVLFYAACLVAYVTDGTSFLTVGLAWLFVIVKTIHVFIHTTNNKLRYRRPVFMVAYASLVLLWIFNGLHLAGLI
ncbi:MAG: MAPEG family protein [Pseudomonadota bacterium]